MYYGILYLIYVFFINYKIQYIEISKISRQPSELPRATSALPTQMTISFPCYQKRKVHKILEIISSKSIFYTPKISSIKNRKQKRKQQLSLTNLAPNPNPKVLEGKICENTL